MKKEDNLFVIMFGHPTYMYEASGDRLEAQIQVDLIHIAYTSNCDYLYRCTYTST